MFNSFPVRVTRFAGRLLNRELKVLKNLLKGSKKVLKAAYVFAHQPLCLKRDQTIKTGVAPSSFDKR